MKNISEIRKIVNFCRKNGVIHFKDDGFEFQLSNNVLKASKVKEEEENMKAPQMDPMDVLLWSSTPTSFDASV